MAEIVRQSAMFRESFAKVLAAYPRDFRRHAIERHTGDGFSGAMLWRLSAGDEQLCLRRWPPEHPSPRRLTQIHAILDFAQRAGFQIVPVPVKTRVGSSFVIESGALWELAGWLPGQADFHDDPRDERLAAALVALAQFHVAVASFPGSTPEGVVPPGIRKRRLRLERLTDAELDRLSRVVEVRIWPELVAAGRNTLALTRLVIPFARRTLLQVADMQSAVQPCIRDIWDAHVLYEGNCVSGIVDFGATKFDSPAADIARLLGSMARDDERRWAVGLTAYESVRPLGDAQRQLVSAYDVSGVVLAGINWLVWLVDDDREFVDRVAVERRLNLNLARLGALADRIC